MTPLFVGLLFGAGVFCIYWSFWPREAPEPRASGPRLTDRMADELVQAGFEAITVRQVVVASMISFAVVLLGAYSTTRALPIAVCFAAMAGYAPRVLVGMRARRRRAQLRDLWPDAVDNIASAVRAGLALPEAEDYRFTGRFQESLDRLKDRLADPVADRLVESLRIAREVGGSDLGRVLRTLSTFLREDSRTRTELETRQGWTVNAARVAAAAPWIVLAMMSVQPGAVRAYSTATGALVLVVGALLTVLAYRLMVRIARLPEDQRVLR